MKYISDMFPIVILLTYLCSVSVLCDDDDDITKRISFPGQNGPPPTCSNCPRNSVCRQVSSNCNNANCAKFPSCVDRNSQSCDRFSCPKDQKCVNILAPCLRAPCPVFPKCVPSLIPVLRRPCRSNNDCSRSEACIKVVGESCNSANCPGRSVCVVTRGNNQEITCLNARCSRDAPVCINVLPSQCRNPPCKITPKCIASNVPVLRRPCRSDNDCSRSEACIKVVGESCNSANCPGRLVCVVTRGNNQELTCRNALCSPGAPVCINILPTQCGNPPCKITPKCIKPEDSIRRPCRSDGDCAPVESCLRVVEESCNSLNCPSRQVCVVTQGNNQEITCRNALCSPGSVGCVNVLPKLCQKPPCRINPKCLSPGGRTPCEQDSDCRSNEHCSDIVSEQCGQPSCPRRSVCINNNEPTCERVPCPPGTTDCITIESSCRTPPCPVSAKCIQDTGNPDPPPCGRNERCTAANGKEGICTEVVGSDCNTPSCPRRADCIPLEFNSCRNVRCSTPGSVCVNIQNPCFVPPCPLIPTCLPPPSSSCGDSICKPGEFCADAQSCADPNCRKFKTCVSTTDPTCAATLCQVGTICVLIKPPCNRGLCGPVTTQCIPSITKPGRCPRHRGNPTICVFDRNVNCLSDEECPSDLKCCNAGCNSVCKKPQPYF